MSTADLAASDPLGAASAGAAPPSGAGPVLQSIDPGLYEFSGERAEILGSYSADAGRSFWPRRFRCPLTGGEVTDVVLPGRGTLWSWSYVYATWPGSLPPGAGPGYGAGLIDLDDDGPRVVGVLLGEEGDWAVGDRVTARPLPYAGSPAGTMCVLAFERESQ